MAFATVRAIKNEAALCLDWLVVTGQDWGELPATAAQSTADACDVAIDRYRSVHIAAGVVEAAASTLPPAVELAALEELNALLLWAQMAWHHAADLAEEALIERELWELA
eukprot:4598175-Alexandrium_andersonii.AAC.1